tara:strand:- start:7076 stop:7219 length:144 start_codon:yes stop_codon:yes gene_type:complete
MNKSAQKAGAFALQAPLFVAKRVSTRRKTHSTVQPAVLPVNKAKNAI